MGMAGGGFGGGRTLYLLIAGLYCSCIALDAAQEVLSADLNEWRPMTSPTLLLLAAGMGSRYGGLKQIDPVGPAGETHLDYSIYDAIRAGFGKVVFVIRKDIEESFREIVGARFEERIAVEYVFQELDNVPAGFVVPAGRTKPWGTAHAILMAGEVIREPFAVINADDFYGAESYRTLAQHCSRHGGLRDGGICAA